MRAHHECDDSPPVVPLSPSGSDKSKQRWERRVISFQNTRGAGKGQEWIETLHDPDQGHGLYIAKQRYFHPDVTVTCDPRDRGAGDLLQSPRLVVEVLSPSTELKDRTWKLQNYTAHPTIEEYMLVSSQSLKIELYRKEQNKWVYYAFGANDEIDLASLDVLFPATEAYEGINPEEDFATREENETLQGE